MTLAQIMKQDDIYIESAMLDVTNTLNLMNIEAFERAIFLESGGGVNNIKNRILALAKKVAEFFSRLYQKAKDFFMGKQTMALERKIEEMLREHPELKNAKIEVFQKMLNPDEIEKAHKKRLSDIRLRAKEWKQKRTEKQIQKMKNDIREDLKSTRKYIRITKNKKRLVAMVSIVRLFAFYKKMKRDHTAFIRDCNDAVDEMINNMKKGFKERRYHKSRVINPDGTGVDQKKPRGKTKAQRTKNAMNTLKYTSVIDDAGAEDISEATNIVNDLLKLANESVCENVTVGKDILTKLYSALSKAVHIKKQNADEAAKAANRATAYLTAVDGKFKNVSS